MANVTRLQPKKPQRQLAAGFSGLVSRIFRAQSLEFKAVISITTVLLVFGLVMVLSSSSIDSIKVNGDNAYTIFLKQFGSGLLGFAAMAGVSILPSLFFSKFARVAYVGAIVFQFTTFIPGLGVNVNGNRSWIRIAGLSIQPAELLKIALILFLADYFSRNANRIDDQKNYTWKALFFAVVAFAPVLAGSDMGTTIVMGIITMLMIWLSGVPGWHMRLPLVGAGIATFIALFGSTSRFPRITAWLFQASDTSSAYAWQSQHGMWALAAGQIFGVGLGMSKLKWSWIPEVENDYIFAIIGEELGLVGAVFTIALFIALGYFLVRIALRCQTLFTRMTTLGIAVWITLQAFINIAVVLQVLPVLGVPLPLISSGGTSLVAGLVAVGICLSFERENHAALGVAQPRVGAGRHTSMATPRSRR